MDSQQGSSVTQSQKARAEYFMRAARKVAAEVEFSGLRGDFERVVRKTQEAIELFFKSKILERGIEPAKTHDLRDLYELVSDWPSPVDETELAYLSEERIPSFYGSGDMIPDEEYDRSDSDRCHRILKAFQLI